MKRILLFVVCIIVALSAKAQDIIIFTNGDEVEAKVMEVSDAEVKYKTWTNQNGPTWVKKTSEIFMIRYENGTKQTFTTSQTQQQTSPQYTSQQPEPTYYHSPAPANQITARKITGSACVGLKIREGYNRISFIPEGNILDFHGTRLTPSFAAYLDYYPKQERSGSNPFVGMGLELMYANRGGTIRKNFDLIPTTFNLSYWGVRPSFSFRDNFAFFHLGVDFSFLAKAEGKDPTVQSPVDISDIANTPVLGTWFDFGFYIGKYVTLDFYGDITFADLSGNSDIGLIRSDAFLTPATNFNWSLGLSLGILFTPMKITIIK